MKSESRGDLGVVSLAYPPANQMAAQGLSKAVLLGHRLKSIRSTTTASLSGTRTSKTLAYIHLANRLDMLM
jgi:hypothetical protein